MKRLFLAAVLALPIALAAGAAGRPAAGAGADAAGPRFSSTGAGCPYAAAARATCPRGGRARCPGFASERDGGGDAAVCPARPGGAPRPALPRAGACPGLGGSAGRAAAHHLPAAGGGVV